MRRKKKVCQHVQCLPLTMLTSDYLIVSELNIVFETELLAITNATAIKARATTNNHQEWMLSIVGDVFW